MPGGGFRFLGGGAVPATVQVASPPLFRDNVGPYRLTVVQLPTKIKLYQPSQSSSIEIPIAAPAKNVPSATAIR